MKSSLRLVLVFAIQLLTLVSSRADEIMFIGDTTIEASDTSFDGAEIIVTNCTLTIDGVHSFSNVVVSAGGVLTHTFAANGILVPAVTNAISGEPSFLLGTNTAALQQTNVDVSTVELTDVYGLITYTNDVDYLITTDGATVWIQRTEASAIPDGDVVLVFYSTVTPAVPSGLNLTVVGNFIVEPGGIVGANGKGYGPYFTTGRGGTAGGPWQTGAGGAHGGYGGGSSSNAPGGNVFDSPAYPTDKGGSGGLGYGGAGANGGGAIKLIVGGALRIDGSITANGFDATNSRSGGGAGGSIWLSAQAISGSGTIFADGGNGEPIHGGGGGGGRIAVYSATNQFTGSVMARGGLGFVNGGAGTIFRQSNDPSTRQLLVDNGGRSGTNTLVQVPTPSDLVISGNAVAVASGSQLIRNLLIGTNGTFAATKQMPFILNVSGNAIVESGGAILADAAGYAARTGPGMGGTYVSGNVSYGSGGGYGGFGMSATNLSIYQSGGGICYGSATSPAILGSGGGGTMGGANIGGAGGGVIQLTISGDLVLNGKISANGGPGLFVGGGGGSGGSVLLTVRNAFSGTGSATANGGNGISPTGGGGGGGRIAIVGYRTNIFSGPVTAYGGAGPGANWGGAGTVYLNPSSTLYGQSVLVLDNGGRAGTNTSMAISTSSSDVLVRGNAIGQMTDAFMCGSLTVASNSFLFYPANPSAGLPGFTINGDLNIQSGGGIIADGVSSSGSGSGGSSGSTGGSYGGYGGVGQNGYYSYGNTYGNVGSPNQNGSPGAPVTTSSGSSTGGPGGGMIRLTVHGNMLLDGRISANGSAGTGLQAGGGSGGCVWLTVENWSGSGSISANGGAGIGGGGGGGGGRIAIFYTTNLFSGSVTAYGGIGGHAGGAGTVYTSKNQTGLVLVDNGGIIGTNTSIAGISYSDTLLLAGGASVLQTSGTSIRNLTVASNSAFLLASSPSSSFTFAVSGDVLVQPGGIISADGSGYAAGTGSGSGAGSSYGTGGGHAGYGGGGSNGVAGGGTYGFVSNPTTSGSGGNPSALASGATSSSGGRGGGAIQMSIIGTLTVDGRISANGVSGFANNSSTALGGGAGGSVWLTVGTLHGAGTISANGGAGLNKGGGGGGGRIAILYSSNTFTGTLSAYGGDGFRRGGAGTVYTKSRQQNGGLVVIDNGGITGTNTPLTNISSIDDVTVRGRAVALAGGNIRNLLVASDGVLYFPGPSGTALMNVGGSATIENGGAIISDGTGYTGGNGPGAGYSSYGSGASHGGLGGLGSNGSSSYAPGNTYDSLTQPNSLGSGGSPYASGSLVGGGTGGGLIKMTVGGVLIVNGRISAEGVSGFNLTGQTGPSSGLGGGSGGSISLSARTFTGSGVISVNGGTGLNGGGGGGGGRIAISGFMTNQFSGVISAYGGNGYRRGGAGTVYLKAGNTSSGNVIVDNGGIPGMPTPVSTMLSSDDLTLASGATATWSSLLRIRNLLVKSNAWMFSGSAAINVLGNATFLAGGGLNADGSGNSPHGAGSTYTSPKGGGGHGGFGGANSSPFGNAYDSIMSPALPGSAGGNGSGTQAAPYGGTGGGIIQLSVNGTLSLDGQITANGLDGAVNSGGGSGGSLWLTVGSLSGTGQITANGGAGNGSAGGGGGGRIAVYYTSNNFAGVISTYGGIGSVAGGAGTIYTKSTRQIPGELLISNGGLSGTNTPLSSAYQMPIAPVNLTIADGASVYPATPLPLVSNLTISAGGLLTSLSGQSNLWLGANNLDVQSGGAISVSGKGYARGVGPGNGKRHIQMQEGSGGGYGGIGGNSANGAVGGTNYGSATQPVDRGSGGGSGFGPVYGSDDASGGGALRLSVGNLNVSGSITADGNPGFQDNSGGGSGGSIWIKAGKVSGDGIISAEGGSGEFFLGGGGGGGRIAIYSPANTFTGLVSVVGGPGANDGADGTVFLANDFTPLQVTSHSPAGVVSNFVSSVDFNFTEVVSANSLNVTNFTVIGPDGPLSSASFILSPVGLATMRVCFRTQNLPGDYQVTAGPDIFDLFGQPMSQVYTGAFTIVLPAITGTVMDTNGVPVPGVFMQPSYGLTGATTDTNGNYAVNIPIGWTGTITPSLAPWCFAPGSITYTGITGSISNQNFLAVPTIAPNLTSSVQGANLTINWHGLPGINYQVYQSTNLFDWEPYGSPVIGSNAPVEFPVPIDVDPQRFFRIDAGN